MQERWKEKEEMTNSKVDGLNLQCTVGRLERLVRDRASWKKIYLCGN